MKPSRATMYERMVVIGKSGVGKTTLAASVASRLGLRHVELDALNWEANWTQAATDVMLARVDGYLTGIMPRCAVWSGQEVRRSSGWTTP